MLLDRGQLQPPPADRSGGPAFLHMPSAIAFILPGGAAQEELGLLIHIATVGHAGDDIFFSVSAMDVAWDKHIGVVLEYIEVRIKIPEGDTALDADTFSETECPYNEDKEEIKKTAYVS